MTGAIRKGEIYRFVAKGRSTEPLQADIREGLISALQLGPRRHPSRIGHFAPPERSAQPTRIAARTLLPSATRML